MPSFENYHKFGCSWNEWWFGMQPSWREEGKSHDVPPEADWFPLLNGGPNGMLIVILALAWWKRSSDDKDSSEQASIAFGIDEVSWVLVQMQASLVGERAIGKKRQLEESSNMEPNTKRYVCNIY